MTCPSCGKESSENVQCCPGCNPPLTASTSTDAGAAQHNSLRYHGLDALRGIAMLFGIVLHAALPYVPNIEAFWPADERSSLVISTIFEFIHIWRMPLFFILTGFFANLVITRTSWRNWWRNRLLRIGLPLVVFFPLMSLTVPWIFHYGETRNLILFFSLEGQPYHLWFLWHLIIFVIFIAIFRLFYLFVIAFANGSNQVKLGFIFNTLHKSRCIVSGILFKSRFPIIFIILCSVINIPTGGELIFNPIASGLFFAIGYSLYRNDDVFSFLKVHWKNYLVAAIIAFTIYILLFSSTPIINLYNIDIDMTGENNWKAFIYIIPGLFETICAILFSYAFIGLAENRFGSYNAKLRFVSDGAYWMYLIHLPIVTLITFFMFALHVPIEIKFLIAIVMTSIICLGTYKYFVRSTLIGILLNGRRHPFKVTGL